MLSCTPRYFEIIIVTSLFFRALFLLRCNLSVNLLTNYSTFRAFYIAFVKRTLQKFNLLESRVY